MKNRHRVSQVVNKLICSRCFGCQLRMYVGTNCGQRCEAAGAATQVPTLDQALFRSRVLRGCSCCDRPHDQHNETARSEVVGRCPRGRALVQARTGPEFIKAPIFNNLILIKKTSTGSDCEFLAGLNDSVGGLN